MPVDKESAGRSVCRDYTRGECGKGRSRYWTCKFSHTLMNTARLKGLLGDVDVLKAQQNYMTLEYFGAFEIFRHHEMWAEGWRITLRARESHGRLHVFEPPLMVEFEDINKAIYELEEKLLWQGFSTGRSEVTGGGPKRDTMCKSFLEDACARGEECKFSHTLLDVRRVEVIVGSPGWYSPRASFLTLEYVVAGDPFAAPAPWRITLRAREGNGNLRVLTHPIIITSHNIFTALRFLEQEAQVEKEGADMTVKVPPLAQPTSREHQAQRDVVSSKVPLSLKPTQQSSYQFGSNADKMSTASKPDLNPFTKTYASTSATQAQPVHSARGPPARIDTAYKTDSTNTAQPAFASAHPSTSIPSSIPSIPAQTRPITRSPAGIYGEPSALPRTSSAATDYRTTHLTLKDDKQPPLSRAASSSAVNPSQSRSTMPEAVPRPSSSTYTPSGNSNHRNTGSESYPRRQPDNHHADDDRHHDGSTSGFLLLLTGILIAGYKIWRA